MKRLIYLILVIMISASVIACADNRPAVENEKHQEAGQNTSDTPKTQDPDYEGKDDTDPNSSAHNEAEDPNTPVQHSVESSEKPSIVGISLGDPVYKVEMILGKNYVETLCEEMGHFNEPYYLREYEGISFIIGKDTQEVLEIEVTSDKYETWLGDKVGDKADVVLSQYRQRFTEPESIHGGGKLEGWFELGDGLVLIFDFDKDDGMIINPEITEDSKVEVIKLTDMKYMD